MGFFLGGGGAGEFAVDFRPGWKMTEIAVVNINVGGNLAATLKCA